MGNKVVDITPVPGNDPPIADGDLLTAQEATGLDKMLPKMVRIGDDVAVVSATLRKNVLELDSSELLRLLNDRRTAGFLLRSLVKLNRTADNAAAASEDVRGIVASIRQGNGAVGELLRDTAIVSNLRATSAGLRTAAETIDDLSLGLREKLSSRSGLFNLVLTDSGAAGDLRASLENIRRGTDNFNQDMEALQHNFLLRGYFRRKAKDSAAIRKPG
jgi:phospholipid/cholesterol/gamma-HCH transport system substrate-binding protein